MKILLVCILTCGVTYALIAAIDYVAGRRASDILAGGIFGFVAGAGFVSLGVKR